MRHIKVSPAQARAKAASEEAFRARLDLLEAAVALDPIEALREIETICTESPPACRLRMGTRVGNILVIARKTLKAAGQ